MAEEWRLTVHLRGDHRGRLLQALHGHEVEEEVRARFGARIAVSSDGDPANDVLPLSQQKRACSRIARIGRVRECLSVADAAPYPRTPKYPNGSSRSCPNLYINSLVVHEGAAGARATLATAKPS